MDERIINYLKYLAGCSALLPFLVLASPTTRELTELSLDELMQIQVTSVSKKNETLYGAAAAVYVVTRDEIRRSGATSIPEALRLVPGVDVARIDPNRWAIGIRGFNGRFANKLLVLMDGRSVYTPTFSGVYWENLDYLLEDVERIEVIRGPGASLWGANSVNGVINIITREASDTQGGLLTLAAGNELRGLIGLRQGGSPSDQTQMRVYAREKRLDGSRDLSGREQDNGGDYLQTGFRLDWQGRDDNLFVLQGDLYRNRMQQEHLVPDFKSPYLSHRVAGTVDADGANLMCRWYRHSGLDSEFMAKLYYDYYARQEFKFDERIDTLDLELQHQFRPLSNHELLWGAGYRWSDSLIDSGQLVTLQQPDVADNFWNVFVQDELSLPERDLVFTLGSKVEGNRYTGAEVQPSMRASWVPSGQLTWWGAVSRVKRIPSRADNEVIVRVDTLPPFALDADTPLPSLLQTVGQTSFEAEQLDAYELGVRWMPVPTLSLDLATFYNDYDNLRSYDVGDAAIQSYDGQQFMVVPLLLGNNMEGRSRGLELLSTWQATEWSRLRLSYSQIDLDLYDNQANMFSQDLISLVVERTPKRQASVWGSVELGSGVELDLRLFYVDKRAWHNAGEEGINSIIDGDMRLGWRVDSALEVSLVGRNLLESSRPEFMTETWPSVSAIERSVHLQAALHW